MSESSQTEGIAYKETDEEKTNFHKRITEKLHKITAMQDNVKTAENKAIYVKKIKQKNRKIKGFPRGTFFYYTDAIIAIRDLLILFGLLWLSNAITFPGCKDMIKDIQLRNSVQLDKYLNYFGGNSTHMTSKFEVIRSMTYINAISSLKDPYYIYNEFNILPFLQYQPGIDTHDPLEYMIEYNDHFERLSLLNKITIAQGRNHIRNYKNLPNSYTIQPLTSDIYILTKVVTWTMQKMVFSQVETVEHTERVKRTFEIDTNNVTLINGLTIPYVEPMEGNVAIWDPNQNAIYYQLKMIQNLLYGERHILKVESFNLFYNPNANGCIVNRIYYTFDEVGTFEVDYSTICVNTDSILHSSDHMLFVYVCIIYSSLYFLMQLLCICNQSLKDVDGHSLLNCCSKKVAIKNKKEQEKIQEKTDNMILGKLVTYTKKIETGKKVTDAFALKNGASSFDDSSISNSDDVRKPKISILSRQLKRKQLNRNETSDKEMINGSLDSKTDSKTDSTGYKTSKTNVGNYLSKELDAIDKIDELPEREEDDDKGEGKGSILKSESQQEPDNEDNYEKKEKTNKLEFHKLLSRAIHNILVKDKTNVQKKPEDSSYDNKKPDELGLEKPKEMQDKDSSNLGSDSEFAIKTEKQNIGQQSDEKKDNKKNDIKNFMKVKIERVNKNKCLEKEGKPNVFQSFSTTAYQLAINHSHLYENTAAKYEIGTFKFYIYLFYQNFKLICLNAHCLLELMELAFFGILVYVIDYIYNGGYILYLNALRNDYLVKIFSFNKKQIEQKDNNLIKIGFFYNIASYTSVLHLLNIAIMLLFGTTIIKMVLYTTSNVNGIVKKITIVFIYYC